MRCGNKDGPDYHKKVKEKDRSFTEDFVVTTSSRSLEHSHTRCVWRSEWNWQLNVVVTNPQKRSCRVIWLVFVFVYVSSYLFLWHENISGVFLDTIWFEGCTRTSSSCIVRKVETRMLRSITMVYVIWRQIWKKRQVNIWTSVCTQEMKWYRRTTTPFRVRHTTSATAVLRSPSYIVGVQLESLCSRFRLDVVTTHFVV